MTQYIEHAVLKNLKADNKNWEIWCDCTISKRHFCTEQENQANLHMNDASIILASSENTPSCWLLAQVWLADEEEVNDGEADELGEVLSSSCFCINYCPFCGEILSNKM